jgi:hypothetical protein
MAEAGRLAELQVTYRDQGLDLTVVLTPWENAVGAVPTQDEINDLADYLQDPEDEDTQFPVFAAPVGDLDDVLQYDGTQHPGRCVIGPDRTIDWCEVGHSKEADLLEYLDSLL